MRSSRVSGLPAVLLGSLFAVAGLPIAAQPVAAASEPSAADVPPVIPPGTYVGTFDEASISDWLGDGGDVTEVTTNSIDITIDGCGATTAEFELDYAYEWSEPDLPVWPARATSTGSTSSGTVLGPTEPVTIDVLHSYEIVEELRPEWNQSLELTFQLVFSEEGGAITGDLRVSGKIYYTFTASAQPSTPASGDDQADACPGDEPSDADRESAAEVDDSDDGDAAAPSDDELSDADGESAAEVGDADDGDAVIPSGDDADQPTNEAAAPGDPQPPEQNGFGGGSSVLSLIVVLLGLVLGAAGVVIAVKAVMLLRGDKAQTDAVLAAPSNAGLTWTPKQTMEVLAETAEKAWNTIEDPGEQSTAAPSDDLGEIGADHATSVVLDGATGLTGPYDFMAPVPVPPTEGEAGWEWHRAEADSTAGVLSEASGFIVPIDRGAWYQTRPGTGGEREVKLYNNQGEVTVSGSLKGPETPASSHGD